MATDCNHGARRIVFSTLSVLISLPYLSHAESTFELSPAKQYKPGQLGFQSKWQPQWLQGNDRYLGVYWDATIARSSSLSPHASPSPGATLHDFGLSAVLRLQRNDGTGFYAEAGTGPQYQTFSYDWAGRPLNSRLALNTSAGVGFVWKNGIDIGFKANYSTRGQGTDGGEGIGVIGVGLRYRW